MTYMPSGWHCCRGLHGLRRWEGLRYRRWHGPVEQRPATIVHHTQSIGPNRPVPRPDEALGGGQSGRAVDRFERKRPDHLGNATSKPPELDHVRHVNLLDIALQRDPYRLSSNPVAI